MQDTQQDTQTPYYQRDGELLVPTKMATGPWSDTMQHGRLFGGLGAWAAERDMAGDGLRIVRVTTELFRAAPMEPITVRTERIRDGRRLKLIRVELDVAGVTVSLIHVLAMATGTPSPGAFWTTPEWEVEPPENFDRQSHPGHDPWDLRYLPKSEDGRRRAWVRDIRQLVEGEEMSPIVRVANLADFVSPLSSFTDAEEVEYINTDITLHIVRPPADEWVGYDVAGRVAADGLAIGHANLFDRKGTPIAFTTASSMAQIRQDGW